MQASGAAGPSYGRGTPDLVVPATRWHRAWLDAHDEWGPGLHEDGFGLAPTDEVRSAAGFAAWVARPAGESDLATYRWIVEDDRVLGGIALRHGFTDRVQQVGHIGFGVRPSARRRGLAAWALGRMLEEARALGMDRVLVVCEAANVASAKTMERLGGVQEDVHGSGSPIVRRYWILPAGPSTRARSADSSDATS